MPTAAALRATEAAFVEDVCRHPGEDAPRLIVGDWLDEHGQAERAEFIRVQCELARHPRQVKWLAEMPAESWRGGTDEGRLLWRLESLRRRERELLQAHRREWLTEAAPPGVRYWQSATEHGWALPGPTGDGGEGLTGASVEFRRGFVEEITLPGEAFLAHAAALFRAAPVRRVTLSGREPSQYPGLSGREWWYWSVVSPVSADPRRVPLALWNLLEANERGDDGVPLWCSRAAALDALSAACLLYGRRAAWPCGECGGTGGVRLPDKNTYPCPECDCRGHTVEEG
jgi:uncharacterized protein (TIGR02996 family)